MGREDYPYCLDCGQEIRCMSLDDKEDLLVFYCLACGSIVEIQLDTQDEKLL